MVPVFSDMHSAARGTPKANQQVVGGLSVTIDATNASTYFLLRSAIIIGSAFFLSIILIIVCMRNFGSLARRVHRAQEHIRNFGFTDLLTGVHNHRSVVDRLGEEVVKAKRLKHPLSIIMADIDYLKRINDKYGFQSGNRVLRSFASIARIDLRPYDVVGRYGGEEFICVLPSITHNEAVAVAERIRSKTTLECAMLSGIPGVTEVTASFGVSTLDDQTDTAEALIKKAERSLLRAKGDGRNRVDG
jgi:two-component system chemotaxis response regulator CheY